MTAQLNPYQASPGTFSTTSITAVDRIEGVTKRLTDWLHAYVQKHQGPVLETRAGTFQEPEGIALPFGWIMVWVEVTAAVPDAEPDEVEVEMPQNTEPGHDPDCVYNDRGHVGWCVYEPELPSMAGHRPGCILAPAHREAGTLACYGTPPGAETGGARWL